MKSSFRYEVKFQNALECGGAYVKLLTDEPNLSLVSKTIIVYILKTPFKLAQKYYIKTIYYNNVFRGPPSLNG